MKKTNKMVSIGQYNRFSRQYTYIERRVYENEIEKYFVRINGSFIDVVWLIENDRKVNIYESEAK